VLGGVKIKGFKGGNRIRRGYSIKKEVKRMILK